MKNYLFLLACCGLMIAVSCKGGRKAATDTDTNVNAVGVLAPVDEKGLATIDIAADYPEEEITLQEIADVEYIPLAISDKVLLRPYDKLFYLSDQYIMVGNIETGEICIFDRAGKILANFNRTGRGPGEYTSLGQVVFDDKAEEFFVFDSYLITTKILVYSFDGKHKRTLTLPYKTQIEMWNFNENTLLAYDKSGIDIGEDDYKTMPYYLISKADGSIVETLHIELPERYSTVVITQAPGENGMTIFSHGELVFPNNRLGGRDFALVDISSDTVYRFTQERVLTPAFVRTPSVHASEPRTVWSVELATEDFIVFTILPLILDGGNVKGRSLKYDYNTGRESEVVSFIDENWSSSSWSSSADSGMSPNVAAMMLDPLRLVEAREKGELSGPLADIAATLKEDDNPVVMIVKFK